MENLRCIMRFMFCCFFPRFPELKSDNKEAGMHQVHNLSSSA